ncbi:MAG: DUF1080 domain-containing protein [Verrucomicrobiales bacterium]|nr:DUF1080 domain-containing protein [Verrucomicrobiales bacterium]MCP5560646.1 DUF1080 domain-containing protein [Verrucomicrobiaceae bacterium]
MNPSHSVSRRSALQLFTLACMPTAFAQSVSDWQPLFDGSTLTGWHPTAKSPHSRASGNKTGGHWRVEDGVIVGSQDTPGNGGLLITDAEYGDVEVSLEMNNDFGPDSGLFMRCTEDGKAYQCLIDYHPAGTIGGILGEGIWKRRGVRNFTFGDQPDLITLNENAQPCPVTPEQWKTFWKVGQWNEIRTRITGDPPTITTWVNGTQILTHTEPKSVHPAKGHIGLQVHGGAVGANGVVRYRNIRIKQL